VHLTNEQVNTFLASDELATRSLDRDTTLWRIHHKNCVIDNRVFEEAQNLRHEIIHWSSGGRFGSPGNEVLYLGASREGAFLETLCTNPSLGIEVSRSRLQNLACSSIDLPRNLQMVDFTSKNLLKNRVDSNVFGATDDNGHRRTYAFAREISKAIKNNPNNYDGLLFQSRVNPDNRNIAVFFQSDTLWRELQSSIVIADQTLFYEPWVYQMQIDGLINLTVID